jgi:hypothetical protein
MMHRLFLVIGLGLLAIGPLLADVVNVAVNGSISGSGDVTTFCLENLGSPECDAFNSGQYETFPFSFSAPPITQLGAFAASGGASSTGPPETDNASIQASVSENTTATADALEITLSQDASSDAEFAGFTLNDSIAVNFNLTEESKIQLTDDIGAEVSVFSNSVELLDSKGNVILVFPCEDFACSTVSAVLPPGTYQLDDQMFNSGPSNFGIDQFFSADLNASFTPVVPEPRWTIIATLLAALLGGYAMSRRGRQARGTPRPEPWRTEFD